MPLSEDEQRILQEIEAQFYATDPQLAQQVSETTLYRHAARSIKWGAAGFVAGFAVLVFSFAASLVIGFIGFMVMLACAFIVERNVRKLGKAGLESLATQMKGNRFKGALSDAGERVKKRFRRDDSA